MKWDLIRNQTLLNNKNYKILIILKFLLLILSLLLLTTIFAACKQTIFFFFKFNGYLLPYIIVIDMLIFNYTIINDYLGIFY